MKSVLISICPKWIEKIANGVGVMWRSRRMIIKNEFPCKNCPKKGCGAYHDVCEAYQAFRQKQATNKSEDAKTRFVANHAHHRVRRLVK